MSNVPCPTAYSLVQPPIDPLTQSPLIGSQLAPPLRMNELLSRADQLEKRLIAFASSILVFSGKLPEPRKAVTSAIRSCDLEQLVPLTTAKRAAQKAAPTLFTN